MGPMRVLEGVALALVTFRLGLFYIHIYWVGKNRPVITPTIRIKINE